MAGDSDDTVRLKVPRSPARPTSVSRLLPWLLATIVVAAAAGGGTWWVMRPAPAPAPVAQTRPAPVPAATPQAPVQTTASVAVPPVTPSPPLLHPAGFAPPTPTSPTPQPLAAREATLADILADAPGTLTIYRFAPQPSVVVLQFPSLHRQALMLNRVAAFVEKAGFPHDKVVSGADLAARIGGPSTFDTFYYGHDYKAVDLVRFFRLATDLNPEEAKLAEIVRQAGWDSGTPVGALVSLVRLSPAEGLDQSARSAILQHELSHGIYFTDPAYASFCAHFWHDVLTEGEREQFIKFLAREGYDTALGDLMINETQAYLMHTPDKQFFNAAEVRISPVRLNELRQIFVVGMPPGWLRDHTTVAPLP